MEESHDIKDSENYLSKIALVPLKAAKKLFFLSAVKITPYKQSFSYDTEWFSWPQGQNRDLRNPTNGNYMPNNIRHD